MLMGNSARERGGTTIDPNNDVCFHAILRHFRHHLLFTFWPVLAQLGCVLVDFWFVFIHDFDLNAIA